MNNRTAARILEQLNLWRRDDAIPNRYEMPNPTEIGIAIELAIEALKSSDKCGSCDDLCGLGRYEANHDVK